MFTASVSLPPSTGQLAVLEHDASRNMHLFKSRNERLKTSQCFQGRFQYRPAHEISLPWDVPRHLVSRPL